MMALWKARGGSLNKDFKEGKGGKFKELGFRSWHCGGQGKGGTFK